MTIDFNEYYDQESDIYYVTFKTGEPSYCKEVDDVLLLEMGMFTNLPTGFRIMNFSKNNVAAVKFEVIKKVKKVVEENARLSDSVRCREQQVQHALEEVLK